MLVKTLREKLISKRKSMGLSLRELAKLTQVSFATLSRLERNEGQFDRKTIERLNLFLKINSDSLILKKIVCESCSGKGFHTVLERVE